MFKQLEAAGMQDPHLLDAFPDLDKNYLKAFFDRAVEDCASFDAFVRRGLGLGSAELGGFAR